MPTPNNTPVITRSLLLLSRAPNICVVPSIPEGAISKVPIPNRRVVCIKWPHPGLVIIANNPPKYIPVHLAHKPKCLLL